MHCTPDDVSQPTWSPNDNVLPPLLARQHDDDDGVMVYWTNNGPIKTALSCDTEKFVDRVTNKSKQKAQVADDILGKCSSTTSISSSRECIDPVGKPKSGKFRNRLFLIVTFCLLEVMARVAVVETGSLLLESCLDRER